jgi:hypothetical protein
MMVVITDALGVDESCGDDPEEIESQCLSNSSSLLNVSLKIRGQDGFLEADRRRLFWLP